jgi:type I restriction enzyme, R subunit
VKKPELKAVEIKRVKTVAAELLARVKEDKLKIDQWSDKEATRDAVRFAIRDHLWDERTGLPVDAFPEQEVEARAKEVFRRIYRAYPTIPSPFLGSSAST